MRVAELSPEALDGHVRTIALADHELGEYLRVDEIARRFDVSVEDVLAAASVLGFDVHDAASLIEIGLFEDAVMHVPVHPDHTDSRTSLLVRVRIGVAATAVVLLVMAGVSLLTHHASPSPATRTAAAYKAKLKATYDATVSHAPSSPDYHALAQQLAKITPPPALAAEHAQLVSDAQDVAVVATSGPDEVKAAIKSSPAAVALQQQLAQLGVRTP